MRASRVRAHTAYRVRTPAVSVGLAIVMVCAARSANAGNPSANLAATPAAAGHLRAGQSQSAVIKLLGHDYARCTSCGPHLVWLYEFRDELGVGVAITFVHGRVSTVVPRGV